MKNFRSDFDNNRPKGDVIEVLSGRYVTTQSDTAITYDPKTGDIISILVTAEDKTDAELLVVEAAREHFKLWLKTQKNIIE